jgi:hypothetical protein
MPKWAMHLGMLGASKKAELLSLNSDLIVGSVRYAKSQKNLASMTTGLFSRCMSGNSTITAMWQWPEEFV